MSAVRAGARSQSPLVLQLRTEGAFGFWTLSCGHSRRRTVGGTGAAWRAAYRAPGPGGRLPEGQRDLGPQPAPELAWQVAANSPFPCQVPPNNSADGSLSLDIISAPRPRLIPDNLLPWQAGRGSHRAREGRMEKPDWLLWLNVPSLTLEQCVCLSLNLEPVFRRERSAAAASSTGSDRPSGWAAPIITGDFRPPSAQEANESLAHSDVMASSEAKQRLALLRRHFDFGSRLLQPYGSTDYHGNYEEKRLTLRVFVRWAIAQQWRMPRALLPNPPVKSTVPKVSTDASAPAASKGKRADRLSHEMQAAMQGLPAAKRTLHFLSIELAKAAGQKGSCVESVTPDGAIIWKRESGVQDKATLKSLKLRYKRLLEGIDSAR